MTNSVEKIISDNFNFLKKDLEDDIILECRGLLSAKEFGELDSLEDEEEKIKKFLEIMSKKSYSNLNIFISKLEQWYSWLHEGLMNYINTINPQLELFYTHKLGGVPNLPLMNVTRTELLNELKNKLTSLKKGHYLVVHGMVGCGKTSLAVQALLDIDILNCFKQQVYWLTAGNEGAADPTILLEELNARLPDKLPHITSPSHLAAIELNKRFIKENWSDSLIVLDDVTEESVLDCFALAAKFLIITRDKGIITKKRESVSSFIKVHEGFTEAESQQLLAKALDIDVISLPHYASDVHKYTKGHPFFLSLFASKLRENREIFITQHLPWVYYIKSVLSKEQKRRSMSQSEFFFKPIKESVDSLDPLDSKFFCQLAVFQEDVNIKPKVLATLWSVPEFEAVDVMQKFVQKSLAVKKWNELQKSYVYGVHDLIGDFLRKDLSPDNEKELHANLMEEYRKSCNGEWSNLPKDDNYIFYYIGYHLKKAGMDDLFSQIYFDLEFIEVKLRVTGPADLLRDFNKYKSLISKGKLTENGKIAEYCNFIEHFGVWVYQGVSIIQAALQTSNSSFVYNIAKELVMKKYPDHCYLKCMAPSQEKSVPLTLGLKEPIEAVCFGKTITEAIIASGNGTNLEVYSFKTKSVARRFSGHSGKINCLNLSMSKSIFLSASFDNTIKIWSIETSETSSGERTPSPQERQESYINFFGVERTGEKPIATLEHSNPVIVGLFAKNNDFTIAGLCWDGTIVMWRNYLQVWNKKLYEFKSIDFCNNDEYLVAASSSKILFLSSETGSVLKQIDSPFKDSLSLVTVLGIQGEGLVLLSKKQLTFYRTTESFNVSYPMDVRVQSPFSKLCSIGPHIAVTTEDGSLFVLNSENGEQITYLQSQKKVVSFCVAERAIIAGYDDGKVFLYPLEALMSVTRLKWACSSEPVIAKMDSIQHSIEVCVGNVKTIEFEIDDIEKMDVSEDGLELVTVDKHGRVDLHSIENHPRMIVDEQPIPVSLFLLGRSEDLFLVLSYTTGKQTLVWRKDTDRLIELKTATAIEFACLLDDVLQLLITSPPFTIWTLDGDMLMKIDNIGGLLRVNPQQKFIAVSTVSGLDLCQFNTGTRGLNWSKSIETTNHVDLLEFSPSGNKLALIETDGTIMVYDCDSDNWKYMPGNNILKKVVYLAVSNSGCICYGGNGLVCIVSPGKQTVIAVLDVSCIMPDPSGADIFAVADKSGHVCKIHEESCNN